MPEEFQTGDPTESAPPVAGPPLDSPDVASLTEDLALAQLKNRDLSIDDVERISQNASLMKSRKVRMALASHPHAPRRVALRLIREFFNFELMHFALLPATAADLKRVADEQLVARLHRSALANASRWPAVHRRWSPVLCCSIKSPRFGSPRWKIRD